MVTECILSYHDFHFQIVRGFPSGLRTISWNRQVASCLCRSLDSNLMSGDRSSPSQTSAKRRRAPTDYPGLWKCWRVRVPLAKCERDEQCYY